MLERYESQRFFRHFFFISKEASFGGELSFSPDSMQDMHSADLCDNFGNIVHRVATLCRTDCGGAVPDVPPPTNPPITNWDVNWYLKLRNHGRKDNRNTLVLDKSLIERVWEMFIL